VGKDNTESEIYRFPGKLVSSWRQWHTLFAESLALSFPAFTIYEFLRHLNEGEEEARTIVDVASRKASPHMQPLECLFIGASLRISR